MFVLGDISIVNNPFIPICLGVIVLVIFVHLRTKSEMNLSADKRSRKRVKKSGKPLKGILHPVAIEMGQC